MNEFTKEELECLLDCCRTAVFSNYGTDAIVGNVWEKLQSMIDNYCEHEYKLSNEWHFICNKCSRIEQQTCLEEE